MANPDAAAHALEGVRGRDGSLPIALAPVEALVRRARVERLFVSRKSRSGSTGSYPGQYDVLRPERALAVDVCLAILRNEGIKEPSVFPGGSFTFLQPPEVLADGLEFRHMAANALAELVTADDVKVLDALEALYYEVRIGITDGARRLARRARQAGRGGLLLLNPFKAEEGLLDTGVLPTLARNREAEWRPRAEARIGQLEGQGDYDSAAGLCLRLAEYERAVQYFAEELRRRDSPVLAHYNIACAYARWSLDEAQRPADRAQHRRMAVRSLVSSVSAGYADWPWIEQDRDLDAIRDEPVYKELVKRSSASTRRGRSTTRPDGTPSSRRRVPPRRGRRWRGRPVAQGVGAAGPQRADRDLAQVDAGERRAERGEGEGPVRSRRAARGEHGLEPVEPQQELEDLQAHGVAAGHAPEREARAGGAREEEPEGEAPRARAREDPRAGVRDERGRPRDEQAPAGGRGAVLGRREDRDAGGVEPDQERAQDRERARRARDQEGQDARRRVRDAHRSP